MVASHLGQQVGALQYFDPRIGIATLSDPPESGFPNGWQWGTVGLLAAAAGFMAIRPSRRSLLIYLVVEAGLSLPTLIFIAFVLWANLGATHGFSIAELSRPLSVFVGSSVAPWLVAYRLWSRSQLAG